MEIYAAAVVYNKACRNSLTCKSLFGAVADHVHPLIIDNSTADFGNRDYCAEKGWLYCSMNGNAGLSRAYNRALELLHPAAADLIVWADDDTEFPGNYFGDLIRWSEARPDAAVFLPVVMSRERMISPALYGKYRIRTAGSTDELAGREITAINSGMAVRASVYQNYRYNEEIFLDYLDHDFMRYCRSKKLPAAIMTQVLLQQSFFADSRPERIAALKRRKIFSRDFRLYSKACGCFRPITELQLLKGRIRLELTCSRKGK